MVRLPDASSHSHPTASLRQVTFTFSDSVSMHEVSGTLALAELAAQSVHGPGRVELDVGCEFDRENRLVRIDTTSDAGKSLALIFLGFAKKEFGDAVSLVRGGEGVLS